MSMTKKNVHMKLVYPSIELTNFQHLWVCLFIMFKQRQPASSKNGSVVINMDGRNYHRGNTTAWTKLVLDLYPPVASTR